MIRLPYGQTFYQLTAPSTLQALYTLDFGSLHQVTGKELTGSANVDNSYFVSEWLETDHFIFMYIDRGYNTPHARKTNKVTPYSLLFNKQTGDFFSLPLRTDALEYQQIQGDLKGGIPFWPTLSINGQPAMLLSGEALKKASPDIHKQYPALAELKDKDKVLMMIK